MKISRITLLILTAIILSSQLCHIMAQTSCAINGSTIVTGGTSATYTMRGRCDAGPVTSWSVSCGTVTSSSLSVFTVLFNSPGCTHATITSFSGSTILATLSVTINNPVPPPLNGGSINNTSQATVNYGTSPVQILATTASGGSCGSFSYQWQSSIVSSTSGFTNIGGATGQNYQPGPITVTTWYQRVTTCGAQTANTSNVAQVNVYPILIAGTISPANQNINNGTTPGGLTVSLPSGGNGIYSYQWQSSADGSFSSPSNVGTNSNSYQPPALTSTQYYRVIITSNGQPVISNTAVVNVYPQLQPGSISPASQSINYNAVPTSLSLTGVSGGNSSYSYQWQSSPDVSFSSPTNVGSGGTTYIPGSVTSTLCYRVVVISNGVTTYSSTALVSVYAQLTPGSINPASQSIAYNAIPTALSLTGVSGGDGSYTYQWQSAPNSSFTNPTNVGSGGTTYAPGNATSTLYYRVVVGSNGITANSDPATINVAPPQLAGGAIGGNMGPINYNTSPGVLGSNQDATGGSCSGDYTYQWQYSFDGINYRDIVQANGASYTSGGLTVTTYFRRKTVCGSETAYSNFVLVQVTTQRQSNCTL